ncbi:MAG: glycoside hydrolase family 9 protein [Lachnospiraceae bacterium]|nr:glycoside hydrolase family 9 protein [Lachnospiraceae bacterium]
MIVVNETGFDIKAYKTAVSDKPGAFYVVNDNEGKKTECTIRITDKGYDGTAGHQVYQLDFTQLNEPGIYHIESAEGDASVCFKIEPHVYKTLKNALQKFLYFQRCGCALEEKHAGIFKRNICHQGLSGIVGSDKKVKIPGGWHDAGDFGRYVSAGAVTIGHLLYAYELFPEAFTEALNLPESGNGMPDLLNECRYELEFLSAMQEEDGGVHHKVTSWTFCGFVMPEDDDKEMFVFPVTSMSTADFAAAMCIASRVYEKYDSNFARDCIHQAYLAGQWLMTHPDNTDFHDPEGCNTGEYTDPCDRDERMWAFAELMRTDHEVKQDFDRSMMAAASQRESRQDRYRAEFIRAYEEYTQSHPHYDGRSEDDGFGWQDVSSLAALAVIFDPLNFAGKELREKMENLITDRADSFVKMQESGYPVAMKEEDFIWGSNMVATNRADVLLTAVLALKQKIELNERGITPDESQKVKVIELSYRKEEDGRRLSSEEKNEMAEKIKVYENAAINQLHYVLGMNAMDISYVTGFGEHAFKDPHNRVTVADNIDRPIPGAVSGGPCTLLADDAIEKQADKDTPAQKCYLDNNLSYSTNEITIYWNSSLLFLVAFFDK